MNPLWLILGAVAALAWLSRNRAGKTVLAVKGGTVEIANLEAVESRLLWEYSGIATSMKTNLGTRDRQNLVELMLVPGALYDVQPVRPLKTQTPTKLGNVTIIVYGRADGVDEGEWQMWWRPSVVTVQQQIARGIRIVPDAFKPDDTETP